MDRELLCWALNKLNYGVSFDVKNPIYSDREVTCRLIREIGYIKIMDCQNLMYDYYDKKNKSKVK